MGSARARGSDCAIFGCKIAGMAESLNILFLAAEAEPFIKVGGLGDVAGSLPRFLRKLSPEITNGILLDVRLVLPMHSVLKSDPRGLRPLQIFPLPHKDRDLQVQVYTTTLEGLPVYFLDGEPIASSGSVYSLEPALDADKYTFFSMAWSTFFSVTTSLPSFDAQ